MTREVIINAGVPQVGKTTLCIRWMVNAPIAYRFIFDSEPGVQSYAHKLNCVAARDESECSLQLLNGWVIFNPHILWPGQPDEALKWFCNWGWGLIQKLPGQKRLIVEEAWRFVNPLHYPLALAQWVQSSAAFGGGCMFNTQTPHKLPEGIQNCASEVICFKLGGKHSLAWAASKGLDPAEVEALPQLHFVARNLDSGGELRGRVKL